MYSDNKKSDIQYGPNQLGDKDDNPSIEKTIKAAEIAWTPGEERALIANIFTKSGITKSPSKVSRQGAPIRWLLTDPKTTGPDSM